MKVPVYTSKSELTTKSGSVFNPGVTVPFSLAEAASAGADSASKWLGQLADWAIKKQDLADKTAATKAKTFYETELQKLRNDLLFPRRDEKHDVLGVSLFKLDNKAREGLWEQGKKILRANTENLYGTLISGRIARNALGVDLDDVNLTEDNAFNAVINKRVLQQAVQAGFKRQEVIVEKLSDKNLSRVKGKQLWSELELDWLEQVRSGLQTGTQIDARRNKTREAILANIVNHVAEEHTNEQGIIKRKWLQQLDEDSKNALALDNVTYEHAMQVWSAATTEERRELIEDLYKQRARQLKIAVDEAKVLEEHNENLITTKQIELYAIGKDGGALPKSQRLKIFGELETLMLQNPSEANLTALEKAREYAHTGVSDRYGDEATYLTLFRNMYAFVSDKNNNLESVVTSDKIMRARLTTTQTSNLLTDLKVAKDTRARYGRELIRNAAGLVEGIEDALFQDEEANVGVMRAIADATAKFNTWYELYGRALSQDEILAEAKSISEGVKKQVAPLYEASYQKKKTAVVLNPSIKAMLQYEGVNGKIEALFDPEKLEEAINWLIKNKPNTLQMKLDTPWRRTVRSNIETLKSLHEQGRLLIEDASKTGE